MKNTFNVIFLFIHDHTFSMGFFFFFLLWKIVYCWHFPVAAMVQDVQDSDLWMRSVKYQPDGEFLSEADEILPAAA